MIGAPGEDSNATGVNGNQADNSAVAAGAAYVFSTPFNVGGTLSGLATGTALVLQINGGELLVLASNGEFTFPTGLLDGRAYNVTVLTPPVGQICSVTNGSGSINLNDVSNIIVNCTSSTHLIFSDQYEE